LSLASPRCPPIQFTHRETESQGTLSFFEFGVAAALRANSRGNQNRQEVPYEALSDRLFGARCVLVADGLCAGVCQ